MLFNSGVFLLFFLLVFCVYYTLPGRWQIRWLIAASFFFYAYDSPSLLALLLLSGSIDTIVSRQIIASSHARMWATAGVASNLIILIAFKYNHLIVGGLRLITHHHIFGADISSASFNALLLPLPIGISFYTFHGISLLVDSFRQGQTRHDVSRAKRLSDHFENTFLYIAFFPQLIAGPIVKAHKFYPQIEGKKIGDIDWPGAVNALIVGYFLKVVIADNLAAQTNLLQYPWFLLVSSSTLVILLIGYTAQIFADFAGYSLIAIGLAKLLGYNLPDNFLFPYISETFSEFWTRWHISLSSWLRDYLYIPLGGNRKGRIRTYLNLMIVMGLGGLWHGTSLGYLVWGLWNGAALAVERFFENARFYRATNLGARLLRILLVMTVWVIGFLFFKLHDFFSIRAFVVAVFNKRGIQSDHSMWWLVLLYIVPIVFYHLNYALRRRSARLNRSHFLDGVPKKMLLGALLAAVVLDAGPQQSFIYFQF